MIKFLVMDVDGTLTDGKIYMGVDGEAFKAFDIKDGYALHTLLKENGIIPVIITARKSPMVEHRCKELGVTEIHQGVMNKLDCLKGILEKCSSVDQKYDLSNVAYIGDDLLDLGCIKPIKEAGGLTGCPSNAVKEIVAICDFVATDKGGEGAVREFVDYLISDNRESEESALEQRCVKASDFLSQLKGEDLSLGQHTVNDGFYYNVIEYETSEGEDILYESHRLYVDIQLLVSGEEIMQISDVNRLVRISDYDAINDRVLYKSQNPKSGIVLRPGTVLILYPSDAHRSVSLHNTISRVVKIVGKVRIN